MNAATVWLESLDLNQEEKDLAISKPIANLYQFLKSKNHEEFLKIFAEGRREHIAKQLNNLPVYDFDTKVLIDEKPTNSVTTYDYAEIKFKISHFNQKGSGYCTLNNYPFPKKEAVTVLMICGGNLMYSKKVLRK